MLDVVLLIVCVLVALGTVLYFFFWNRAVGAVLGWALRWILWDRSSGRIWVEFGSVHLSLPTGRFMVRDLRYHSSNQTFRVVRCQISWRYWIRRVAEEEDFEDDREGEGERASDTKSAPKCRIHVAMEGFEWFMYNRTAAFESILSQMTGGGVTGADVHGVRSRESEFPSSLNPSMQGRGLTPSAPQRRTWTPHLPLFLTRLLASIRRQLPDLNPWGLLPISLEASKGAIILGNKTTESLLMAQFAEAEGTYGIVQTRSKLDLYKQLLRINFEGVLITLVENTDRWASMIDIGEQAQNALSKTSRGSHYTLSFRDFQKLWTRVRPSFKYFGKQWRKQAKAQQNRNKSRARSAGGGGSGGTTEFEDPLTAEYAIDRKILEAPVLRLEYYADVAGQVPVPRGLVQFYNQAEEAVRSPPGLESMDVGNGGTPPEWGVEVFVKDGSVHYGPWADRQRAQIQRVFFPPSYHDTKPTPLLQPGDLRTCTCLKVFFEFSGTTTLHVPFREASKNWQWDELTPNAKPDSLRKREAASIQIKMSQTSTVKYLVPMFATEKGYLSELRVFLDKVSVTSSLNDAKLLDAKSCSISSNLPSPLQWSAERAWVFDIAILEPKMFLFRDHINMLTDLGRDWSSGPPHDFNTYIPMIYGVNLGLSEFELNLFANDHNVVDKPLSRDDNVLFTVIGKSLRSEVLIPSNAFRPLSTTVSFDVRVPDVAVHLTLPRWNTHALRSSELLTDIGRVKEFCIEGSYQYYSEIGRDFLDQLKLEISGSSAAIKLFGWVVRHAMVLRDNYFGSFTHYSTTREYLDKRTNKLPVGDPIEDKYRPKKSNGFHLDLTFMLDDCILVKPAGSPGYEFALPEESDATKHGVGSSLVYRIPEMQIHLRLHDYFMELSINIDPLVFAVTENCTDFALFNDEDLRLKDVVSIDGISITANRLFGPQPRTSTYVCVWNLDIGKVTGLLRESDARTVLRALKAFGHNYSDPYNSPAKKFAVVEERDATFVKLSVRTVDLTWCAPPACMRLFVPEGIRLNYSTLAGATFRKVVSVDSPSLEVQLLLSNRTGKRWLEVACLETGIAVDMYQSPAGWIQDAEVQRDFLNSQDAETGRFAEVLNKLRQSGNNPRKHSSLYLPKLERPRLFTGEDAQSPRTRTSHVMSERRSRSFRTHEMTIAESDGEFDIPESVRDERLANSRPAVLSEEEDLDDHSSTIDESDEISSISSSDSLDDFSDFGEGESDIPGQGRWPNSVNYWKYCRRYIGVSTQSLSAWETSMGSCVPSGYRPFVMRTNDDKERNPFADAYSMYMRPSILPTIDDTKSESLLRVSSRKQCEIIVTPLVVMAIPPLVQGFYSDHSSVGLWIDDLTSEVLKSKGSKSSRFALDAALDVRIRVFQDITISENQMRTSAEPRPSETRRHGVNNDRVMSVFEVNARKSRVILDKTPNGTKVDTRIFAEVEKVEIVLGSMVFASNFSRFLTHNPSPVLEWDLHQLALMVGTRRVSVSAEDSFLTIHEGCQDIIFTSVWRVLNYIQPISSLVRDHSRRAQSLFQLRLRWLVGDEVHIPSRNMLSAIQPSFFVQTGEPSSLREDLSWKFLFHLREYVSTQRFDDLPSKVPDEEKRVGREELLRALQNRQTSWAADNDRVNLMDTPVSKKLVDGTTNRNDTLKRPLRSMEALLFKCGRSTATFRGAPAAQDLDQTTIELVNAQLSVTLIDRPIIVPAISLSPSSITARKYSPETNITGENTLDAILRTEVDTIRAVVYPKIIKTLHQFVHAWKGTVPRRDAPTKPAEKEQPEQDWLRLLLNGVVTIETHVLLRSVVLQAAAENIIFELSTEDLNSSTAVMMSRPNFISPSGLDVVVNHVSTTRDLSVKAKTRASTSSGVLAAITVTGGAASLVLQRHAEEQPFAKCVLHTSVFEVSVPRSAIRLYYFIDQWRQDYLPGLGEMLQPLALELRKETPKPKRTENKGVTPPIRFHLHASANVVAVTLQVMHGTWLTWKVLDVISYAKTVTTSLTSAQVYGLQLTKQKITVASMSSPGSEPSARSSPKIALDLSLPTISVSGSHSSSEVGLRVLIKTLRVNIKPAHWDALLSVQQKFGSDFNDLLLIISENRKRLSGKSSQPTAKPTHSKLIFDVQAKFEGFNISMESPAAIQYLECHNIHASLNTRQHGQWSVNLTDLSAYLLPKATLRSRTRANSHSVFVTVDLNASDRPVEGDAEVPQRHLSFAVTKFHALMQPSSINELSSFIDHIQTELLLRKEQRALELIEFKNKASRLMQTFNIKPTAMAINESNFLGTRCVELTVTNFGAAFPLALDQGDYTNVDAGDNATKAFLFSIKSVKFQTQRGETGQAVVKGFAFQFVSRFRQNVPEDYRGDAHQTLNRLIYPEMTARVQSDTTVTSRHVYFVAGISGFVLDLDPSIADYMFSLIDVYRHGKLQVEKLSASMPKSPSSASSYSPSHEFSFEMSGTASTKTVIQASLKFLSGTVRMHTSSIGSSLPSMPSSYSQAYSKLNSEAEIFSLPELSVWSEYRTNPPHANGFPPKDNVSSLLAVKATIHSSKNTLRPTLLLFVTEIVRKFEGRMQKATWRSRRISTNTHSSLPLPSPQTPRNTRQGASSGLQMTFSLRIDQSRLELTCKPDVNVTAGLHWQSGGFVITMSPGDERTSVMGSVEGLTVSLKHGFLTEDCIRLDAKNLSFAVSFSKVEATQGKTVNSISIIVDTEFSGGVRFSRLQDFLCFKAVWLDRIPILNSDTTQQTESDPKIENSQPLESDLSQKQGFSTAIAIRVRQISLEADLGQSISTVALNLMSMRFRTRLTEEMSEIGVTVDRVDMTARGNLSGHMHMPDFSFQTLRKRRGPSLDNLGKNNMLELSLTSGSLDIQLQSDWQWLLQYRADPLEAHIYDDWNLMCPDPTSNDKGLRLHFTVDGSKVTAIMTIMAIPKLVMYAGKFVANLEAQREGASRESSVFRATRLPKPENALSEVATAMFQTARSRLKEYDTLIYAIEQHIQLKLDEIAFVLLPRSQGDNELARFIGRGVKAELQRTVVPNGTPADRHLLLSLANMSISQLIRTSSDHRPPDQEFEVLTDPSRPSPVMENIIFALPAMDMKMMANEEGHDGKTFLVYDFDSSFIRLEGQKNLENINITLNISLYSWLTTLHKTFSRELKRAQEVAGLRGGMASPLIHTNRVHSPEVTVSPTLTESPPHTRPSSPAHDLAKPPEKTNSSGKTTPQHETFPTSPVHLHTATHGTASPTKSQPLTSPVTTPSARTLIPGDSTTRSQSEQAGVPDESVPAVKRTTGTDIVYKPRKRHIERLTVRQLGEATPDVMHPFFTKRAGFNLEDSLPQYVHEYATLPLEEIMKALVKLYSRQLRIDRE